MVFTLLPATALAANGNSGQSITLSPTSQSLTIQPGSSATGQLKLFNQGDVNYSVKIYPAAYSVSGEDYDQSFTKLPGAPDVASWFTFDKTKATLNANDQLDINYTIAVPKGTLAGGYYATAFAETQGNAGNAKNGVIVHQRVGAIFYLTVAGDLKTTGTLESWTVKTLQKPPLEADLRIANTGNVHFPVEVNATVKDIFGRTKFKFNTQKEVLPQTIRKIPIIWPSTPTIALVKVEGTAKFLGQTHQLGSHYVLVVSNAAWSVIGLIVALLLLWIMVPRLKERRKKKSNPKKK